MEMKTVHYIFHYLLMGESKQYYYLACHTAYVDSKRQIFMRNFFMAILFTFPVIVFFNTSRCLTCCLNRLIINIISTLPTKLRRLSTCNTLFSIKSYLRLKMFTVIFSFPLQEAAGKICEVDGHDAFT